jgi:hypothetical protein
MNRITRRILTFAILLAPLATFAQQPPPQQQPANATGKWTLYCKDPNGSTSTKYLDLEQQGAVIKGHFKGPNQSGSVQGTIDREHLVVKTNTRNVLTFRGRVEGNKYTGTFHDRGGTGSFEGVRSN